MANVNNNSEKMDSKKTTGGSIKVSAETKAAFDAVQSAIGKDATQEEAIKLLLKYYKVATKGREELEATPNSEVKLRKIWEAVKDHNNAQLKIKQVEARVFIPFNNRSFIELNTGLNRARDIKPFFEKLHDGKAGEASEYETLCKKWNIDAKHKLSGVQSNVDKNERNIYFQSVLEQAGIVLNLRK
jgi:hypothetical protein